MKKIIAVLISLLFVGSIFGIASVTATCDPSVIYADKPIVYVGDTFTTYLKLGCFAFVTWDPGVLGDPWSEILPPVGGYTPAVFRPVAPGTVKFQVSGCDTCTFEVRVLERKSLPMHQILKIVKGNKDKE